MAILDYQLLIAEDQESMKALVLKYLKKGYILFRDITAVPGSYPGDLYSCLIREVIKVKNDNKGG